VHNVSSDDRRRQQSLHRSTWDWTVMTLLKYHCTKCARRAYDDYVRRSLLCSWVDLLDTRSAFRCIRHCKRTARRHIVLDLRLYSQSVYPSQSYNCFNNNQTRKPALTGLLTFRPQNGWVSRTHVEHFFSSVTTQLHRIFLDILQKDRHTDKRR